METSWTDGDNTLQIHNQQFGAWTLKITRKDVCDSLKIRLTDKELQEIIDMLQECIPTETTNGKVLNPKNPEDITETEERYVNIAKSATNLEDAIIAAKEIYREKSVETKVFLNKDVSTDYISLTKDVYHPYGYNELVTITRHNVDNTNEEIITSKLM